MDKITPLDPRDLCVNINTADIPWPDSRDIPSGLALPAQPRALKAMDLALRIKDNGYNVYLAGDPDMGRTYFVNNFLEPLAGSFPTPPDIIYVYDFDDADHPKALYLPAGQGRALKAELAMAMANVKRDVNARSETESYLNKRHAFLQRFQDAKSKLMDKMANTAEGRGFNLDMDEQGSLTLYPLIEGKVVSEEEFERLDHGTKQTIKSSGQSLMRQMRGMMRRVSDEEKTLRTNERNLDVSLISDILDEHLNPLVGKYAQTSPELALYFQHVRNDILSNPELVIPPKESLPAAPHLPPPMPDLHALQAEDIFSRYEINLFVDNAETRGAPIIIEAHPTHYNLLGCVEREAEMGTLISDFTLIKAGAIYRAIGGFLILHIEDLLQNVSAWEGLLRSLRSGYARIEDPADASEQARAKTIEPDRVPLDLKVFLIGTDETYELLLDHDDRFAKLFKVKAHMQETVPRDQDTLRQYAGMIGRIIREANLLPFDRSAIVSLMEYSSVLAEDQRKLSLKFPKLREIMIEASTFADMRDKELVDALDVQEAGKARGYRSNLYEQAFLEEYDRELIKVATVGSAIGRVNGLSVSWFGDYEFGLPHQIAATVGVGSGGIIDLEREASLGGPIHTKAIMILKTYLLALFAQDKPLVLSGSLCFEQSYAHIEGDSASGAELACLLSAIAGVPLRLSLAFTGAVSQAGAILAVGGVSRKIEGFFQVCQRRGLTGEQGVIIPHDNVDQLMLNREVIEAVTQKRFHIYPVKSIEEALSLLTDRPVAERGPDQKFAEGTLYRLVDDRLTELTELQARYHRQQHCGD